MKTKNALKNKAQLTQGPVGLSLMKLAFPMVVSIVGMMAFNLVDTFFVGRLGTLDLAAMSFTFPVVLVVSGVARGLGVGTSSVLSRVLGGGNHQKLRRMTTDAILLSILIVVAFAVVGIVTIEPLFRLLGASDKIIPLIKQYMLIWYLGVPVVVIPMVGNNAIRATGDTVTPSGIMLVAIIVNIIMDPLLIFGIGPFPRMELAGAALATVLARTVTLTVALLVLSLREKMLTLKLPTLKELMQTWKPLLYVGVSAATTYVIIPLSMGFITRFVSVYGEESVAGFGVATRIETFALTLVAALSIVLVPFVGQNMGAEKLDRIRLGVKYSHVFALFWGLFLFLVFFFSARYLGGIFNRNPQVISVITLYLSVVSLSYGAQGVLALNASVFNAMGKPLPAAGFSLIRMFGLYIPLALLGSHWLGLTGIFTAAVVANFISALASFLLVRNMLQEAKGIIPAVQR